MRSIRQHIYFERRRLILAGMLAFVAGALMHLNVELTAHGIPFPLIAGSIYAGFVVMAAGLTTYLFPALRWLIDGVAIIRLVFAVSILGSAARPSLTSPLVSTTIVVGGAIVLVQLATRFGKNLGADDQSPMHKWATQIAAFVFWIDNKDVREGVAVTQPLRHVAQLA